MKRILFSVGLIFFTGCYTTKLNDGPELPESYSDSLTPEQTAEVLSIIMRYSNLDLYVIPDIPDKKLVNARKASKVPLDEKILCLVNATVLGSAKNSLLVGLHGIYFRNDWSGDSPGEHFLSYAELESAAIGDSGWYEMSIGRVHFNMAACGMPRKKLICMLQEIQELLVYERNDDLRFKQAMNVRTVEVLEAYLQEFPEGHHVPEAISQVRVLRLKNAREAGTVAAYEAFLRMYPEGTDSEELRAMPALRAWESSKRLGELVIRLCPKPGTYLRNGRIVIEYAKPETAEEDLAQLQRLLEEGASPNGVRITGFRPAGPLTFDEGVTKIVAFSSESLGDPGHVVPAEQGGMTLLGYCKANKLDEVFELLESHGAQ